MTQEFGLFVNFAANDRLARHAVANHNIYIYVCQVFITENAHPYVR